jgi:hypothetical protein
MINKEKRVMGVFISRHYRNIDISSPPTVDEAITVLEDQVKGWFLDIAQKFTEDIAADFVVLMVIASYFEGYQILRSGQDSEGRSKKFFREGFKDFLSSEAVSATTPPTETVIDDFTEKLYKQLRCGLFHIGMTRQIGLSRSLPRESAFQVRQESDGSYHFMIHVPHMLTAVRNHFDAYLSQIRNPNNVEAREKFKAGWNVRVSRADGSPSDLTIP